MSAPQLRLFGTHRTDDDSALAAEPAKVTVSVADALPLLLDAARTHRAWLNDFADDSLEISQDLYEVLLAYREIGAPTRRAA